MRYAIDKDFDDWYILTKHCIVQNRKEVEKMVNSKRLKERMEELGLQQRDIAEALNLARPTVSQKLNNVRPMDLEEAEKLQRKLKIPDSEFGAYFFSG